MTEQTSPDTAVPEFPERAIREAFTDWADQKTIQGQWTSWTANRQREFLATVEGSAPGDLVGVVAAFLDSPAAEPEPTGPQTPSGDGGSAPAEPGSGPSSGQTSDEEPNAGDRFTDAELEDALRTAETIEAAAKAYPDRIGQLLDAERAGKARKTVVPELERLQQREQERATTEGE